MVADRDWGEEVWEVITVDEEFQFCKMKISAYLLHNNVSIVSTTKLNTYKWFRW